MRFKMLFVLLGIMSISITFLLFPILVRADELEEINRQLQELKRRLEMSEKATKPLEGQLVDLRERLNSIRLRINKVESGLKERERRLQQATEVLQEKELLLKARISSFYKRSRKNNFMLYLIYSENTASLINNYFYEQNLLDREKQEILKLVFYIRRIDEEREYLSQTRARLERIKEDFDRQAAFLEGEIAKAKKYQAELRKKIAELTKRQKELLAARSGLFAASIGEVPLPDDPASGPDFDPGFRPAFAAFSFGAYTHRKGMSQYGAKGRAESGQNYKEILKAYYGKEPVKIDTSGTINVQGYGELDFEGYYLLGIAEMPHTFPFEALKAQAVAARTFAFRYKSQGKAICTTQACQVFRKSKADNPPDEWRRAVEETRGEIIPDVIGFYSSTTGGYLLTSGWDTKCGSNACWPNEAYEKIAKSPWFYKAWYRKSYLRSSDSCGRAHPWLTKDEFLDILNAWVVRTKGNESDVARILPVTIKNCPVASISVSDNPFSMQEMKRRADELGGAFREIYDISVKFSKDGYTSQVIVSTDRGRISIPGEEFKTVFNLRAPGYISIRNKLFNIEKK